MSAADFQSALDAVEASLQAERAALLSGDYKELDRVKSEKLTRISDLDRYQGALAVSAIDTAAAEIALGRIRKLSESNAGMMQAAIFGARAAQDRLHAITGQESQIGAYNANGRPLSLGGASRGYSRVM